MSIRGDRSRKKIMEAARGLFAAKGFAAVSMQDICGASGISRGGLYRHYASTGEVFAAIIQEEQALAYASLEDAKERNIPPEQILLGFLRSRMTKLLDPRSSIDNATAEFAAGSELGREILQKRAASSVQIVTQMLELGVSSGAFSCENCPAMALHIMCSLEGMGKHNALLPMSPQEAEAQLQLMFKLIK